MSFEKKYYDSAVELKKNLRTTSFLLKEETSESNRFVKFSNELFDIGFIYYDVGLEPQIMESSQANKLFLGINSICACIDSTDNTVCFEEQLTSLLYEILTDASSEYVVYVCELDILVYKNDGSFLWKMGFKDIVEDYYLEENGKIVIECSDGDKTAFSLDSGRVK